MTLMPALRSARTASACGGAASASLPAAAVGASSHSRTTNLRGRCSRGRCCCCSLPAAAPAAAPSAAAADSASSAGARRVRAAPSCRMRPAEPLCARIYSSSSVGDDDPRTCGALGGKTERQTERQRMGTRTCMAAGDRPLNLCRQPAQHTAQVVGHHSPPPPRPSHRICRAVHENALVSHNPAAAGLSKQRHLHDTHSTHARVAYGYRERWSSSCFTPASLAATERGSLCALHCLRKRGKPPCRHQLLRKSNKIISCSSNMM